MASVSLENRALCTAAKALGIKDFEMKEGNPANLVVLTQESVWKAFWEHEAPLAVIKAGKDVTQRQEAR